MGNVVMGREVLDKTITLGAVRLVAGSDKVFPDATHRLVVDLRPGGIGTLLLHAPTIEAALLVVDDGVDRSFVPISPQNKPRDHFIAYFEDGGWHGFERRGRVPGTVNRVRLTRGDTQMVRSGAATASVGYLFTFGVFVSSGDRFPVQVKAYANDAAVERAGGFACRWEMPTLSVGDDGRGV